MAKVIGKILSLTDEMVSIGTNNVVEVTIPSSIVIIGLDGTERIAVTGDFLYAGERIKNTDSGASMEVKYLALSESTTYEDVFDIAMDDSVHSESDAADNELNLEGVDEDEFETAAGEEGSESNSGIIPDTGVAEQSNLQGLSTESLGRGVVDFGTADFIAGGQDGNNQDQDSPVITSSNVVVFDENSTGSVLQLAATDTNPLTYTINTGGDSALFSITPTGTINFNTPPNYESPQDAGADNEYNFTVTITDSVGNFTTQAISVNINNVGEAPTAVNDTNLQTNEDTSIIIGANTLLANDTSLDTASLSITAVNATSDTHGSVKLDSNGDVVFTPQPNYFGAASFAYTISDSNGESATATVAVNVTSDGIVENVKPLITEDSDSMVLSDSRDRVNAKGGDDYIDAQGGNDVINGQAGNDTILGGDGKDTLYAGTDADTISGGADADRIYANDRTNYTDSAVDTIDGGTGNDTIYASGEDKVDGGAGYDTLDGRKATTGLVDANIDNVERVYGSGEADTVSGDYVAGYNDNDTLEVVDAGNDKRAYALGGAGDDTISVDDATLGDKTIVYEYGGTGADNITGSKNSDRIYANSSKAYADGDADTIDAGAGNDYIYASGEDSIDGGAGYDTLYANKAGTTALDGTKITNVERVYGSSGDDVVSGDRLYGKDGNDTLTAVESADDKDTRTNLYGDAGDDTLTGSAGQDYLYGGTDADTINAGDGADRIYANSNKNYSDSAVDTIDAGAGKDVIYASGEDKVDGGAAYDTLDARKATVGLVDANITNVEKVLGTNEADSVTGDRLYGYGGDDTLTSKDTVEDKDTRTYLYGGDGDDTLTGAEGQDYLYGGADADTINAGDGADKIYANSNKNYSDSGAVDTIDAGAGNDVIYASGEDKVDGGTGYDTLDGRKATTGLVDANIDNVERVYGSAQADTVSGDYVAGYDGNDTLKVVDAGNDKRAYALGGAGEDTISVDDTTLGDKTIVYEYGGTGADNITGSKNSDRIYANSSKTYSDSGAVDTIDGGAGNDIIYASGEDKVDGGTGYDTLDGRKSDSALNDTNLTNVERVYGSSGDDVVSGDRLYGYDGADTLTAVESDQDTDTRAYLYGGDGDDKLTGSVGTDYLYGGNDADTIDGGAGSDRVYGQDGDDTLVYDSSDRVIDGGADNDTLVIDAGSLDLRYVGRIANMETIELSNGASITDSTGNGINIADVMKITGDDELIIKDTSDGSEQVKIDQTEFTKNTDNGDGTITYSNDSDTHMITIDSTIDVI